MSYHTFKEGQYSGRGPDPALAIYGENAGPQPNPYSWIPMSSAAHMLNWDVYNLAQGFNYSATDGVSDWYATLENSGTALQTNVLSLLTGAADNNAIHLALCKSWVVTASKTAVAICRATFPSADLVESDFAFGFGVTILDPDSHPTDGAYIVKADGAATFLGRTKDNSTESDTATLGTSTAVAWDFAVVINGTASVDFYSKLASASTWSRTSKTSNLPRAGQKMRLGLDWQNGDANARTLTVERCLCFMEKVA